MPRSSASLHRTRARFWGPKSLTRPPRVFCSSKRLNAFYSAGGRWWGWMQPFSKSWESLPAIDASGCISHRHTDTAQRAVFSLFNSFPVMLEFGLFPPKLKHYHLPNRSQLLTFLELHCFCWTGLWYSALVSRSSGCQVVTWLAIASTRQNPRAKSKSVAQLIHRRPIITTARSKNHLNLPNHQNSTFCQNPELS